MSAKTKCPNKHIYTPRCNHKSCWDKYFKTNINKMMMGRMVLKKVGREVFELTSGRKFTKNFMRFCDEMDKEKSGNN